MTDETFAELTKSAKQALAYERGEVSGHRVTRIAVPRPPRPMSSADIARGLLPNGGKVGEKMLNR